MTNDKKKRGRIKAGDLIRSRSYPHNPVLFVLSIERIRRGQVELTLMQLGKMKPWIVDFEYVADINCRYERIACWAAKKQKK